MILNFGGPFRFLHLAITHPLNFKTFTLGYGKIINHFLLLLPSVMEKLLMNLKLLLGYWKSLSLIFVVRFINNERGIKDHHLVYRQPPPREPGITPWF